jgi:hypothetical protein
MQKNGSEQEKMDRNGKKWPGTEKNESEREKMARNRKK